MLIETVSQPFQIARPGGNSTDASYPTRGITAIEPTGDGVIDTAKQGAYSQNSLFLVPYGTTTAVQTFNMRVLGWRSVGSAATNIWVPVPIAELTCVLSTMAGIAGGAVNASQLVCDTISLVAGTATLGLSCEIVSPTGNIACHAVVAIKGFQKVELIFNMESSAVSANCLVGLL